MKNVIKYYVTDKHLASFKEILIKHIEHNTPLTDQRHIKINILFWLKRKTEKSLKNPWRVSQMRLTQ